MKRRHLKLWLLSLALVVLCVAAGAWYLIANRETKPDFAEVGGTILVYEVDERSQPDVQPLPDRDDVLAKILQKRLDASGLGHVSVHAQGKGRVEFDIARTSRHEQDVATVKELIKPVGRLDFRMLANAADDREGQTTVSRTIAAARDLPARAKKGLPPPTPMGAADPSRPATFRLFLAGGSQSIVSYDWVELGPTERIALNLDSDAGADPARSAILSQAQQKLNQAAKLDDLGGRPLMQGALFFVRRCENQSMSAKERLDKQYDIFILARDPEIDPADPGQTRRVPKMDGSYVTGAEAVRGDRPSISFQFSADGANLFGNLTRKNVSSGLRARETIVIRHLGVILDGLLLSAPTIQTEIRGGGIISGSFTQKEAESLAAILRAGALPVSLKPVPLSETQVAPRAVGK